MMKKHFKTFLGLLFSLSLVFSACDNGAVKPGNDSTPTAEGITLTFDENAIECKEFPSSSQESIKSGAKVKEGKRYEFTAKIADSEIVENWYINEKKQTFETSKTFRYTISATDAGTEKTINISYQKKTAEEITLTFDEDAIECKEFPSSNTENITSGTKVKEGKRYEFTAKIADNELVVNWYVNGKKQILETSKTFRYTISATDAGTEKTINISYIKKTAEEITLTFDENAIECKEFPSSSQETIKSGTKVKEGKRYEFTAKIADNELIVNWYVNGKKKILETSKTFRYTISATDANTEKTINISYIKKNK